MSQLHTVAFSPIALHFTRFLLVRCLNCPKHHDRNHKSLIYQWQVLSSHGTGLVPGYRNGHFPPLLVFHWEAGADLLLEAEMANATPFLHETLARPDVFAGSAIASVPVTLKTAWEVGYFMVFWDSSTWVFSKKHGSNIFKNQRGAVWRACLLDLRFSRTRFPFEVRSKLVLSKEWWKHQAFQIFQCISWVCYLMLLVVIEACSGVLSSPLLERCHIACDRRSPNSQEPEKKHEKTVVTGCSVGFKQKHHKYLMLCLIIFDSKRWFPYP